MAQEEDMNKDYTIRLEGKMTRHIVIEARKLKLLPSEYLRKLILDDMQRKSRE